MKNGLTERQKLVNAARKIIVYPPSTILAKRHKSPKVIVPCLFKAPPMARITPNKVNT